MVEVYEREESIDQRAEQGYTVSIREDGDHRGKECLQTIGVWEKCCREYGGTHKVFSMLTPSGTVTCQFKTTGSPTEKNVALRIHRGELRRALLDALPSDVLVSWNKKCTGYHQDDESSATVHFEDGTTATGDLVIACDGINSKIRVQMMGEAALSNTNNVGAILGIGNGIGSFVTQFQYKGESCCNWALFFETKDQDEFRRVLEDKCWEGYRERSEELKQKTLSMCKELQLHDPITQLVESTDSANISLWAAREANVHHKNYAQWQDGRVVLMGDAAHATTPFGGAGANMALEDALVLSSRLSGLQPDQVEAVVQKYVAKRHPKTKKIILQSHAMGENFITKGWRPYLRIHLPFYLLFAVMAPTRTQKLVFGTALLAATAAAATAWMKRGSRK